MPVSRTYSNITITAPLGTSQHGRPNILCFPARWTTVLAFIIPNYVIHAFTIWKRPGEKTSEYIFACFLAFLLPVSGLGRGLDAMYRHAVLGESFLDFFKGLIGQGSVKYEVRKAAKAGALGIIVREHSEETDLHSSSGSSRFEYNRMNWHLVEAVLQGTRIQSSNNAEDGIAVIKVAYPGDNPDNPDNLLTDRNITGFIKMNEPSSYSIMEVPATLGRCVRIKGDETNAIVGSQEQKRQLALPQSSSIAPVFFALIQVIYATYGLVRDAGDQFERYGFASFSLSVIPYISMSIINLFGNLLTPTYTSITLVQTSAMQEAVARGNIISTSIGEIHDDDLFQEQDAMPMLANTHDVSAIQQRQTFKAVEGYCAEWKDSQREAQGLNFPSSHPVPVKICFDKHCVHRPTHSWKILVTSGQPPPKAHIHSRQGIFKLTGLICAILPYILCMALVPPTHALSASSTKKAIIITWTTVDFIVGLYLLWSRTSLFESFTNLKFLYRAAVRRFPGHPPRDEWSNNEEKEEEYLKSERWFIFLFLFCVVTGLVVAGFYFYFVVDGLLEFGNCRAMSG